MAIAITTIGKENRKGTHMSCLAVFVYSECSLVL